MTVRGRKRKSGKRYPCGKRTRSETEKDIMQTAIEARQRHHGVTAKQARDERLGTAFGRLAWHGTITTAQYEAGCEFGELYRRHHMVLGLPLPSPRSIAGLLVSGGIFGGSSAEPDALVVERLRRRFDAATDALDQCDRDHRFSPARRPALLIYRVVCVDEDTTRWPSEDLGNLRVALNALVRLFRVNRE
jgi:hypothetical protein